MPRSKSKTHAGKPGRRSAILDASVECFVREGLAGTKIEDLCDAAGVSVGTLYHHFGSKEELLHTTYMTVWNGYLGAARPILHMGLSAEETVRESVRCHLRWLTEHRTETRFIMKFFGLGTNAKLAPPELLEANRDFAGDVRTWLDGAIAEGSLKPMPLQVVSSLMFGPVYLRVLLWLTDDAFPQDDEVQMLIDGAWNALRVGDG